jgi:hypothetical protein
MLFIFCQGLIRNSPARVSTPEQKCVGWPEQKYISDAGRKPPKLGAFFQASSLGRAMLIENAASPAFRDVELAASVVDELPSARGPYQFPET